MEVTVRMGYTTLDLGKMFEEALNSPEVADAIPQAWNDRLYGLFSELKANLEELCFKIRVTVPASTFNLPVVKLTSNPFQAVAEGSAPTEAVPIFEKVQVSIEKRATLFQWTYEVREDVPKMISAIEELIRNWLIFDWDQRIISLLDNTEGLTEVSGTLSEDLVTQAIEALENKGREVTDSVLAVSPTEAKTIRKFEHFIPKVLYKGNLEPATRYEIGRLWDIPVTVTKTLAGKAYLIIKNSILHAIRRGLTIEDHKRISTEIEVYKVAIRDGFSVIDPDAIIRVLIT